MVRWNVRLFWVVLLTILLIQVIECSRRRSGYTSRRRASYTSRRRSYSSRRRSSSSSDSSDSGLENGYIIALVVCSCIGGVFLVALAWCYYNQRKSRLNSACTDSVQYNPNAGQDTTAEISAKYPSYETTAYPSSNYGNLAGSSEKKDGVLPPYESNYDNSSLPPPPAYSEIPPYPPNTNNPPVTDNVYS